MRKKNKVGIVFCVDKRIAATYEQMMKPLGRGKRNEPIADAMRKVIESGAAELLIQEREQAIKEAQDEIEDIRSRKIEKSDNINEEVRTQIILNLSRLNPNDRGHKSAYSKKGLTIEANRICEASDLTFAQVLDLYSELAGQVVKDKKDLEAFYDVLREFEAEFGGEKQ